LDSPSVTSIRLHDQRNRIFDGQYFFTGETPATLFYHLRLPLQTYMDVVRVQSDPQLDQLKVFIEQQERSLVDHDLHTTARICRLPRDHLYDYARLRVRFLKDNFIRIEIPTSC
jgi:hypothetical protein